MLRPDSADQDGPTAIRPAVPRPAPTEGELSWRVVADGGRPVVVGLGALVWLAGWAQHRRRTIRAVSVEVAGAAYPAWRFPPGSVEAVRAGSPEGSVTFGALIPVPPIVASRQLTPRLVLAFDDGATHAVAIDPVALSPQEAPSPVVYPPDAPRAPALPRVAIGMATYQPPLDLFARQVQSLRDQQHTNWRCVINDDGSPPAVFAQMRQIVAGDPRFQLFRNDRNLGFYHNFERVIELLPADVDFIALCDQDDTWYPEKLAATLRRFTAADTLVFTDMDVVTRDGQVLYHTNWVGATPNYTDFGRLLYVNAVAGAASVFRADLRAALVPFPPRIGQSFHDHWLASVALAQGALGFIPQPLYAYTQHGANAIGHGVGPDVPGGPSRLAKLAAAARRRLGADAGQADLAEVVRLVAQARTLQLRRRGHTPEKQAIIERFVQATQRRAQRIQAAQAR